MGVSMGQDYAIRTDAGSGRQITATDAGTDRAEIPDAASYDAIYVTTGDAGVHYAFGTVAVTATKYSTGVGDPKLPKNAACKLEIPRNATHVAFATDSGTSVVDFFPYTSVLVGGGA